MVVEKVGQDESVARLSTCKRCGAILQFYDKDIQTSSGYSMGELEVSSWIKCPECKNNVHIKDR